MKAFGSLKAMLATLCFSPIEPLSALDQRHLGRQVIALHHLYGLISATKPHVFNPAVSVTPQKPEGVHQPQPNKATSLASQSHCRELSTPATADAINQHNRLDRH